MSRMMIKYLVIGLVGPAITYWIATASEGNTDSHHVLLLPIACGIVMSVLIASSLYPRIRQLFVSILLSVILSEIGYTVLVILYMYLGTSQQKAEGLMWLPVILAVIILYTLPMAFTVSYSAVHMLSIMRTKS